ncbi:MULTISPECIES: HNH endonuclease signature motif containing protein [Pseudoalteromonas]|uniref:HNH endonuclease signature motif containing protein n=1 Tax=Pseudoalteromonas TaxID=53246 RepID=UPI0015838079|nr:MULTISPECIES: HNH endonuclease signature motif containing protein [Pseudoalteromonas]MDI4652541.1 HNH endonuclease [Pseudoalteromonas shioyasakiensis]NUJ38751.1 HNH endonuclease [Pseudoalteromonas sp. 0303]
MKSKAAIAAGSYVLVKWVPKYLKSQSPEIKKKALQKITGVLAKHPSLTDKALSIANKVASKNNIAKDRLDKFTAFLRTNTSLPPPLSAAVLRTTRGTAWGVKSLPVIKEGTKWLKGSHGSFGKIPRQVGEKLSGKSFNTFSEFRSEFWKQVSKDSVLSKQFNKQNISRMKNGKAPFASETQHNGLNRTFQIHHKKPINQGGSVYSLDNLLVVSPKYHKYILDKGFHYGK